MYDVRACPMLMILRYLKFEYYVTFYNIIQPFEIGLSVVVYYTRIS